MRFFNYATTFVAAGILAFCPIYAENYDIEVLSWGPRIFIVKNFLSDEECQAIIQAGKPHLEPSVVIDETSQEGDGILDKGRVSMGMFFPRFSEYKIVRKVEERISRLTLTPEEYGEGIQLLHYEQGGQFIPHHDFFNNESPGGRVFLREGGQRLCTVILYLNTPEEGGETIFPLVDLKVKPVKGQALIFYDCLPGGEVDERTLHGGAPVLKGEKWIATKWLRAEVLTGD